MTGAYYTGYYCSLRRYPLEHSTKTSEIIKRALLLDEFVRRILVWGPATTCNATGSLAPNPV